MTDFAKSNLAMRVNCQMKFARRLGRIAIPGHHLLRQLDAN